MSTITSTIKQLEANIKGLKATAAAEAAFKKLSKPMKRVAIAQDVIASLKAKQLTAQARNYLTVDDGALHTNFQTALALGQKCTACALGSLFVCAVKVQNDVCTEDAEYAAEQVSVHGYLSDIFSVEQLSLIETAFECSAADVPGLLADDEDPSDAFNKAIAFGHRYESDHTRMVAIMKNIIKHEGTFVP